MSEDWTFRITVELGRGEGKKFVRETGDVFYEPVFYKLDSPIDTMTYRMVQKFKSILHDVLKKGRDAGTGAS